MDDFFQSIRAFFRDRAVSPLAGAFVIAWLVLNHRVLFILFSGDHYSMNFSAIDHYFALSFSGLSDWWNLQFGRLLFGVVCPLLLATLYIYGSPFLAKPVYEYALRRREQLRKIKQAASNARLYTVEESREIDKRYSQLENLYNEGTTEYRRQITSLTQTIDVLEERLSRSLPEDDQHSDEAELEEYDAHIDTTVENLTIGEFSLRGIFPPDNWDSLPMATRTALDARFKAKVDRGDFLGVTATGTTYEGLTKYEKVEWRQPQATDDTLVSKGDWQTFQRLIQSSGLSVADFTTKERLLPANKQGGRLEQRHLVVTYKPTGKSESYAIGPRTDWLSMFQNHLSRGNFTNRS